MKNKELEMLLKNIGCFECIPLIEVCEHDRNIKEIEVDKKNGFTSSNFINECIELYLKKLNIKVKYVNMKNRIEEIKPTENIKPKTKCLNAVHAPFKRPMSKEKKIEMYKNYKMKMFSLDDEIFVVCQECKDFVKL